MYFHGSVFFDLVPGIILKHQPWTTALLWPRSPYPLLFSVFEVGGISFYMFTGYTLKGVEIFGLSGRWIGSIYSSSFQCQQLCFLSTTNISISQQPGRVWRQFRHPCRDTTPHRTENQSGSEPITEHNCWGGSTKRRRQGSKSSKSRAKSCFMSTYHFTAKKIRSSTS